jgi:L-ascorbate metabolism protein UlaG (beta-lactamase superfamily)
MYTFLTLLLLFFLFIIYVIFSLPVFGGKQNGERLNRIISLPNYNKNSIENQSPTPALADDANYWRLIKQMIKGNVNASPKKILPHLKPNFNRSEQLKITWFGHSSYFIQVNGKNILVDPVFSQRTSPFQFLGTKSFSGTNFIKAEDFPELDIILITHDHYDHLDYLSILKLKHKALQFITSLGVGAHLEKWGIQSNQIIELAWDEKYTANTNLSFTATPARHFSGRKFTRNQTLWSSFVLKTGQYTIFLGGDSGYDNHFKKIGETYGPFDLAILECGQYNKMWPLIHMFPKEVVQACLDLNAKRLLPVHWGKYKLALHNWDEPIIEVVKSADERGVPIVTPKLGETFILENDLPKEHWWLNL